jgi:hypothetical protein
MAGVRLVRRETESARCARKTKEVALEKALDLYVEAIEACPLAAPHRYEDRLLLRRMTAAAVLAAAIEDYRESGDFLSNGSKAVNLRAHGALP